MDDIGKNEMAKITQDLGQIYGDAIDNLSLRIMLRNKMMRAGIEIEDGKNESGFPKTSIYLNRVLHGYVEMDFDSKTEKIHIYMRFYELEKLRAMGLWPA